MPSTGFQEWWRAQLDAPRNRPAGPPICPCASCFNGTPHTSAKEKKAEPKHQITAKKFAAFGSRESVASDMVPLRSTPTWASRSSLESTFEAKKPE
ncbi:hypothetical protein GGR58DRAFT_409955 [Xylaria digitata]|uniref:Uncharacterized protein n=1 Tax=Xylaria multiplex TaxID=323545 RepID=A0A7C8MPE7_9PEZI|nr:hypothetical protein GQX73_g7420 [Xylaria multiplex]KAI0541636.1 hypothetical protein GGR58DRAFT_409955 [Xylaria digitata]